jgi:hypothetical protein
VHRPAILATCAALKPADPDQKRIWRLGTRRHLCARSFAEPITLPSTHPGDFRLPATTLRICFVLPASRARRRGDIRGAGRPIQDSETATSRYLRKVQFSTFPQRFGRPDTASERTKKRIWRLGTRRHLCARSFAEPVSLSSTDPGDFRLPATALRVGFDLLALRARRRGDIRAGSVEMQASGATTSRYLQKNQFSTFPQLYVQPVDKVASRCGRGRSVSGEVPAKPTARTVVPQTGFRARWEGARLAGRGSRSGQEECSASPT